MSFQKIHYNTVKDKVTVTLSNFSQNDGTIRILAHFLAKNHSKLPIADKNLILWCCFTLHLTCAFQVIKLPNERVIALFHHFFLQFLHISLKSVKQLNFKTPVLCISQILTNFNLYSGRPRMGP